MDADYSRDRLIWFIDWLGDKRMIPLETSRSWRVAAGKLLHDLSEAEEQDVRKIDVDLAVRRMSNRNPGALNPTSLNTYKSRVQSAIQEFVSWVEDPTGYKPRGSNGKTRPKKASDRLARQERPASSTSTSADPPPKEASPSPAGGLSHYYPLRDDFLAQFVLPRDLTVAEARKLGAWLLTMARDYEPS